MDTQLLIDALEKVFNELKIPVRYEHFHDGVFRGLTPWGGLCRINGTSQIIIHDGLDKSEKAASLLRALASLNADLEEVFMPPAVRLEVSKYVSGAARGERRRSTGRPKLRLVQQKTGDRS